MVAWCNEKILGVFVPLFLLGIGAFFLWRLRAFPFLRPRASMKVLTAKDGTHPFRALSMALAGTLGIGNISGVALAVACGGAGAVFWMWVSAFAAMMIKYAEIVLAMAWRKRDKAGNVSGGAMFYMRDGIGGKGGAFLAALFSALCVLTALSLGGMMQANAVTECMSGVFGIKPLYSGILLTALTAAVVLGGASRISALTEKLVPLMTLLYAALSLAAILPRAGELPGVFARIFAGAFSPRAAGGGIGGFFTSRAVRFGVTRGLLSNEAGCGTAPMAHATADNPPAKQGLCGVIEVFVDTILLCSMTAFTVLLAYEELPTVGGGVMIALGAYRLLCGAAAEKLIGLSLLFFAYGTVICWAYYGEQGVGYFTPSPVARRGYYLLFCGLLFAGSFLSSAFLWDLTDLFVCCMTLCNGTSLCLLCDAVVTETARAGLLSPKKTRRMCREKERAR